MHVWFMWNVWGRPQHRPTAADRPACLVCSRRERFSSSVHNHPIYFSFYDMELFAIFLLILLARVLALKGERKRRGYWAGIPD